MSSQRETIRVVIPERPAWAPGVTLVGELRESGFEDRFWLVQRGDRFVQLSELLYRIVEHADGRRTVGEIARAVTECTEWRVTPDDVRKLVAARLLPLGLIATENGEALRLPGHDSQRQSPSPLRVNLRVKLFGARTVDRIAAPLRHLFVLPVVITVLLAVVAAHVWFYATQGIMGAFIDALYTPASLLVVLVLVIAAALFHEFGHAAALRYGGGLARGIGAGVYLIFPAFYTDVTDSYRLGRWARVRTGLGGVYFHLIFALGVIGVSVASGREFLLIAVLLMNLEILRQFIPFVRLDGYWVLADLTGVPDFFSQMPAFVRGVLGRGGRDRRLPKLKRWVHGVFAVYALATVPVLGILLYFLVTRFPRLVTVTWDALRTQADFLLDARRNGEVLLAVTSASQLLVVGFSALAIGYFLYALTSALLRTAWRQPAVRRAPAMTLAVGMIGVIGVLWAPELPFAAGSAPAGVREYSVAGRQHVAGSVSYPMTPPVGGDHAPVWQNCGFYDRPVRPENAVHSLEHGAVWITYHPGLAATQVERLRRLAERDSYLLVSPLDAQAAPVVATAWGRQLHLGSVLDARLGRFIEAFRLDARAPEAGGACSGGEGTPE